MSIPAHKVVGDVGKPGQVVSSPMAPDTKPDVTLNDYIARKTECCGNPLRGCKDCPPPKKMTFDEWLEDSQLGYRTIETKADLFYVLEQA